MNVERALKVVPREAVVTAECEVGRFGSGWQVFARMPDGYERVLTSMGCEDAFAAAAWVNQYDQALAAEKAAAEAEARMELTEKAARALYVECGGDPEIYPWPCNKADHYRKLVKVVLDMQDEGV